MSKVTWLLAALALVGLTSGVPSDAEDEPLTGKTRLINNPPAGATANKLVYLAKDPSVVVGAAGGAGDPQCSGAGGGGAILRVLASGGSGEVTLPLPCGGWTTNAANTRYVYKDPTGATSDTRGEAGSARQGRVQGPADGDRRERRHGARDRDRDAQHPAVLLGIRRHAGEERQQRGDVPPQGRRSPRGLSGAWGLLHRRRVARERDEQFGECMPVLPAHGQPRQLDQRGARYGMQRPGPLR